MAFKDYRDLIRQMEREMQQMSDEAFRGFFTVPLGIHGRFWQPSVDIHETDQSIVVKMELSGAKADDIQVALAPGDRVLTISGTRSETDADRDGRQRCHQLEIYFGPFERSISLPSGVQIERDSISASYRDGFLNVILPKRSVERQSPEPRTVPITNHATDADSDDLSENEGEADNVR